MKAVILVGGEGTRLRPLTYHTPKCLVPVLNTPFLETVLRQLCDCGITTVVLALGHLSPHIRDCLGDGGRLGVSLVYSVEDTPMGTAGPVKMVEEHLDDTFVVLNGDIFTELDIAAMLAFHRERKAKATIALTPVEDPTAYGLIETDRAGRVTRFLEKPTRDQVTTNMINAGTYILEPDVLGYIPPRTRFMFERGVFPALLERGELVYAYPSDAYWVDIGTPERYRQLNVHLLNRRGHRTGPAGKQGHIHPTALVTGAVEIGDRCSVGRRARLLGPAVIGDGCDMGEDALVSGSVIWRDVRIGPRVTVQDSIVADDCCIGDGSTITGSVLGDNVTVSPGVEMKPGSKIEPGTVVI